MEQFRGKLFGCIERIEKLLPEHKKADAERHVNRAWMYFLRTPMLQGCSPDSFIQCCLDSSELGLPLDGKLAHAVVFNTKVKHPDGRESWEKKAQFMPDYKGLVAIAKRTNLVADVYGDVVCENDEFDCYREGDKSVLKHRPNIKSRGETVGAYVIISGRGINWRYEYMTGEQIQHIRNKSKAKDNGPWVTDFDQMAIKTVVKRALKFYNDDPTLIRAIELDDAVDVEFEHNEVASSGRPKKVSYQPLALPKEVASSEPAFAEPVEQAEPEPEAKPTAPVKQNAKKQAKLDTYGFAVCENVASVDRREDDLLNGPDAVAQAERAAVIKGAADRRAELA
jgi:phage RecT family recombinase